MAAPTGAEAVRLADPHRPALAALLEGDPDVNLFLLSTLSSWGLDAAPGAGWWGLTDGPHLRAACWLGRPRPDPGAGHASGLAVPCGEVHACERIGSALARTGPPRMVIGPREASDGLWLGLGAPAPRLWYDQRLYLCTAVSPGPALALRLARPDEFATVSEMAARMMAEDLGEDPREVDAREHEDKVRARLLAGRILVGVDRGEIVFKLDIGSRIARGVQVGGTWVPPHRRGEGLAKAGMRGASRELLARHGRVTLHVNEANLPAVRAYEAVGFVRHAAFRLASR